MDYLYFGSMIFTSVMSLSLALFFKSEIEPKLNLSWRLFMVAFVIWSAGRAMSMLSTDSYWALFWIRIAYCGSIWLSVLWTWMGYEVLKKKIPRSIFFSTVAIFAFFTVMNFTPYFISKVSPKLGFKFYDDDPGWAFNLWSVLFTLYAIWIHIILILEIKRADGLTKNRIRWILLAGVLGFGGSATTFPLVNDVKLYPFAVPLVAISPAVLTYAVVRFQLMDLYLLLRDTTVHLVSSLVFAAIFVGIARAVNNSQVYVWSMIIMAAVIPLAYPQVSRFVRRKVNRTRLGDVDRYLEDIEEKASALFGASFSIKSLSEAALDLMTSIFPVSEVSVYFMRTKTKSLHLYARKGMQNDVADIESSSEVFTSLGQTSDVVWKGDQPKLKLAQNRPIETLFNDSGGEVLCPIFTTKQLSGLILLGKKNSLSEYHQKDIKALQYIADKVEIACGLAMASEKYSVVMGEWSHSLNQITKPIEQKAEIIRDFIHLFSQDKIKSAADIILTRVHQLRKFHDYITNTTALTRELITGEFKKETVNVSAFVRDCVQKYKMENREIVSMDLPDSDAQASISVTGIDRVITELLSNSLRHTQQKEDKAKIVVSGHPCEHGFEIKVIDNGDGIDPSNIEKIWEAGWQQKDMNAGASGLGLSICKQTIEAHGGKVKAHSAGKDQGLEISFVIPSINGLNH